MSRILILHASVGQGHKTAALALQDAFKSRGETQVIVEDLLDYALPVFKSIYADSYLELAEKAPDFMSMFYRLTDKTHSDFRKELVSIISRIGVPNFKGFGNGSMPDAIIHTHHLGMDLLKNIIRLNPPIKTYCVVTDYTANSLWAHEEVSKYFVANQVVKDILVNRNIDPDDIFVSGIPVRTELSSPKYRKDVCRELGITKFPVVSFFGAGIRDGKIKYSVSKLMQNGFKGTIIIVAGRNTELLDALSDFRSNEHISIKRYEFTKKVDDIIVASDLVVSKAGGLIISETLARGRPLLLLNGIRGQEEWNADYISSLGVALQVHVTEIIPYAILDLIQNRERLEAMTAMAKQVGKPNAALDIADRIIDDLS